ncbi:MAG TPA: helix-turn-helix domain-containing protein [Terriglobia bacterium]|nr:helix-turn-helix domain-containing protein [Terriglobia bacterium]
MSKDPVPGQGSLEVQRRIAFSVREVALQTGLSQPFIRLEIKRGNLRASRVGRRVVVLVTAMDEWLNEGTWLSAR